MKVGPIGLFTGEVWHSWFDQGQYLRSTLALARGNLASAEHWYPLLYSASAVPFVPILPGNPFLILDVLCVALLGQSVTRVAARLGIGGRAALLALILTWAWPPAVWSAWVQPWTSTLSAALIWWLMAMIGDLAALPPPTTQADSPHDIRAAAAIGFAAALIPLTRPADAIVVLVLGLWLIVTLSAQRRLPPKLIASAIMGGTAPICGYAVLHLAIYGAQPSDYMRLSAAVGTNLGDVGWKAAVLFGDPVPWFPNCAAVFTRMPWVALGLAGTIFVAVRGIAGRRSYVLCLITAAVSYAVLMTAYVDLLPPGLWNFDNIHYFKWIFPLLGMLGWLLLRDARHARGVAATAVLLMLAITGLRFDAVPARPDEPARRIDFTRPAGQSWQDVYFAQSVIVDHRGVHRNILEYRQIADGDVIRAVALRGAFSPDAKWYGSGMKSAHWPIGNGSPPRAGIPPAAPVARWKARLGWGVPCWLAVCAAADLTQPT